MRIAALSIYPVKALGAVTLDAAVAEPMGLAGDRRLMLVDETHTFLTQREEPRLASLRVRREGEDLVLEGPGFGGLAVGQPRGARATVTVWGAVVDAVGIGEAADAALSGWLGRPVRLVAMDAHSTRYSNPAWAPEAPVGFADGFPVLIANAASLDALNDRIVQRGGAAVPMARFRPNIVVDGANAWAEDGWASVAVGEVVLDLIKPCQRCIVTTTDQEDGSRTDDEPLATLAKFRRSRDRRVAGVLFGWNAVPRSAGRIAVGDPVSVVEERVAWPVG